MNAILSLLSHTRGRTYVFFWEHRCYLLFVASLWFWYRESSPRSLVDYYKFFISNPKRSGSWEKEGGMRKFERRLFYYALILRVANIAFLIVAYVSYALGASEAHLLYGAAGISIAFFITERICFFLLYAEGWGRSCEEMLVNHAHV